MINWKVMPEDERLIGQIVERAAGIDAWGDMPRSDVMMDITATHANGCPLDLPGLLGADRLDFAHDVGGIRQHIDRTTGKLQDCFLPRYAMREIRRA